MKEKVIISKETEYNSVVGCYKEKVYENYNDLTFCKECGCENKYECEDTRFNERYRILKLCDVI